MSLPSKSAWIPLEAGPLEMVLDPTSGFLRYVRLGAIELLRGIYVAVRDPNWLTVAPAVSELQVESDDRSFRVSFVAECRRGTIDFAWKGTIVGSARGEIRYGMDGLARSTFRRNRIGFCVLHPAGQCAGRPCVVHKSNGMVERGEFPEFISPHQPFLDIRSIAHEVMPGLTARVSFEGDVFEMEDQRNWSDASYKTYCTPLALTFPVEVARGTVIRQAVNVALEGRQPPPTVSETGTVILGFKAAGPLPRIGLGVASHGRPLSARQLHLLRCLKLDHLRVDLDFSDPRWAALLAQAAAEAEAIGASLHVAIFLSDAAEDELDRMARAMREINPRVSAWLVFHAREPSISERAVRLAAPLLKSLAPQALVGGGTNAYFAQVNRQRLPLGLADMICFSVNPQVHAFDNASLMETLQAQPQMVASARRFTGGAKIAVSPLTLRPRFNPDATGAVSPCAAGELPLQVDPRQCTLFAGGWTLGSIAQLATAGPYSLTYYETTGWRGVMETEEGSPLPQRFSSLPGGVFPVYHVLADLAELRGRELAVLETSDPLKVQGLAAVDSPPVVLIANLTSEPQTVELPIDRQGRGPWRAAGSGDPRRAHSWRMHMLDEPNVAKAATLPLEYRSQQGVVIRQRHVELPAYAYARLDLAAEEVCP